MVIIKCRCVIQRLRLKKLEPTSADMRDSQQYQDLSLDCGKK